MTTTSNLSLSVTMKTSRENFFQNLGKSEVFHRTVPKEANPRALRKVDHLIENIGIPLVEAVRSSYDAYLADPKNPKKAESYRKWRLRLHLRANNNREVLELINEYRVLGLTDDGPGELCFEYDLPFKG
jgi:hypothetical protein